MQPLFSSPIRKQLEFPELHPGHASYVWLVETDDEEVVVRTTRMSHPPAADFWWGCQHLFGIDPTDVFALEPLNELLNQWSGIPVPRVIRKAEIAGRPFVVVEKMPGQTVTSFSVLSLQAMERFGECLAHIHQHAFHTCGTPSGRLRYPVRLFHQHMTATMHGLVERFYGNDRAIAGMLDGMCQVAATLPHPDFGSLIMMDMDPTQFLSEGGRITALVDTEVYAVGPRALELIALEYLLEEAAARAFQRGYTSVLHFPDLSAVRPVYRYLNRLLQVQGPVDIETWMHWPLRFP